MFYSFRCHFLLVLFFVSPPPNILRHIPVNLASVFKSLTSLHEVKRVTHCTSFQRTPPFQFWHGPILPDFLNSERKFRIWVHYETSHGSHCSEMTCWKCEFAASFWLSWSSLGCIALLSVSLSPDFFLHPRAKHGWTKTQSMVLYNAPGGK